MLLVVSAFAAIAVASAIYPKPQASEPEAAQWFVRTDDRSVNCISAARFSETVGMAAENPYAFHLVAKMWHWNPEMGDNHNLAGAISETVDLDKQRTTLWFYPSEAACKQNS